MSETLTREQQAAVDHVTAINLEWRAAKFSARARLQKLVLREVAALSREQDLAVRRAVEMGVPRIVFRQANHGLHTVNPYGVAGCLQRTASVKAGVKA